MAGDSPPMTIPVIRLRAGARLPRRMSEGASGFDLHACLEAPLEIQPGRRHLVPTGIALQLPAGFEGQVRPRSGLAVRHGIGIPNAPGTIDADYRGEVCVILINWGDEAFRVEDGDRIAQLVIARVADVGLAWTDRLEETARGAGGFGHTGTAPGGSEGAGRGTGAGGEEPAR